jgi:hypothetical protein
MYNSNQGGHQGGHYGGGEQRVGNNLINQSETIPIYQSHCLNHTLNLRHPTQPIPSLHTSHHLQALPKFVPGKVFVGGLSNDTTRDSLQAYAAHYGTTSEIYIKERKGYGFITFEDITSAQAFLDTRDHVIDGRPIEAKAAVPKSLGGSSLTKKLFVGGLPFETTLEELQEYFGVFGDITEARILKRPDGTSRGFGFVEFQDEMSVEKCLVQYHTLKEKSIDVKRSSRGPGGGDSMAPPLHQQQQANSQYPPEWICPQCSHNNFARRSYCQKCEAPRGPPPSMHYQQPPFHHHQQGGGGGGGAMPPYYSAPYPQQQQQQQGYPQQHYQQQGMMYHGGGAMVPPAAGTGMMGMPGVPPMMMGMPPQSMMGMPGAAAGGGGGMMDPSMMMGMPPLAAAAGGGGGVNPLMMMGGAGGGSQQQYDQYGYGGGGDVYNTASMVATTAGGGGGGDEYGEYDNGGGGYGGGGGGRGGGRGRGGDRGGGRGGRGGGGGYANPSSSHRFRPY